MQLNDYGKTNVARQFGTNGIVNTTNRLFHVVYGPHNSSQIHGPCLTRGLFYVNSREKVICSPDNIIPLCCLQTTLPRLHMSDSIDYGCFSPATYTPIRHAVPTSFAMPPSFSLPFLYRTTYFLLPIPGVNFNQPVTSMRSKTRSSWRREVRNGHLLYSFVRTVLSDAEAETVICLT